MITDETAEKAVMYLASTAKQLGEVCGNVELQAHMMKTHRAMAFLEATGTVAEKEHTAWTVSPVMEAIKEHADAITERETIRALRKAAELKIEIWRTQSASNRARMI